MESCRGTGRRWGISEGGQGAPLGSGGFEARHSHFTDEKLGPREGTRCGQGPL